MEKFIGFLLDNYIYIAIAAGFLILALFGYIIDTTKTEKMKKNLLKENSDISNIPVASLNDVSSVNKTTIPSMPFANPGNNNSSFVVPPVSLNSNLDNQIQNGQNGMKL